MILFEPVIALALGGGFLAFALGFTLVEMRATRNEARGVPGSGERRSGEPQSSAGS